MNAPVAVTDGIEAHVAVGALVHVDPSRVRGYVLLVVTTDDTVIEDRTLDRDSAAALMAMQVTDRLDEDLAGGTS